MKVIMNDKCLAFLNKCVTHENSNHNLYMNCSYWCIKNGMLGAGKFFKKEAEGELVHMNLVMSFVNDRNAQPCIMAVEEQAYEFKDFGFLLDAAMQREVETEQLYEQLSEEFCEEVSGIRILTFDILREQVEEIGLYGDIIAEWNAIKDSDSALMWMDKKLGDRV